MYKRSRNYTSCTTCFLEGVTVKLLKGEHNSHGDIYGQCQTVSANWCILSSYLDV